MLIKFVFGIVFCVSGFLSVADNDQFPAPAGEHPRILFTKKDLPKLRKAAATPEGKEMVHWLKHKGHGGRGEVAKAIMSKDAKQLQKWTKGISGQWDGWGNRARCAALYYQITGNPQDGKIAAGMFRIWLDSWKPEDDKKRNSWGSAEWALTYDWIYDQLTSAEREKAENIFAVMVGKRASDLIKDAWYMEKTMPTGRQSIGSNWTALCMSNLSLSNMVLEGKKGYNPELNDRCLKICRAYLNTSISPNGAMFEGMNYAMTGFGTHHLPLYLIALRNRGYNFYKNSNLQKLPTWIAYETLPWGYESFDFNKSHGFYGPDPFPVFVGRELGQPGKFVYNQATGNGLLPPNSTVGLINSLPGKVTAMERSKLPLCKWFSVKGIVFCRSGWGPEDVMLAVNTNPIRAGHSHADHGSFCIAGYGAYLIADSGLSQYGSKYHNLVHIDGKAINQYGEGGNESFIRSVEMSPYADIIDIDLKPAYDKYLFDESGKYTFKGPWIWKEYNKVEYADRYFNFIRGAAATFIVVADHIKKDGKIRNYDWLARTVQNNILQKTGQGFTVSERFGGKVITTLQQGKVAVYRRDKVPDGVYRGWLLIRGAPCPKAWASNNLLVNNISVPYNEAYFGRGNHRGGWRWLPIRPNRKNEIPVKNGSIKLEIRSNSGGMVALAVFTQKLDWKPGDELPSGKDFIVMPMADPVSSNWEQAVLSKGMMDVKFLGKKPEIKIREDKKAKCRVVSVRYRASQADFLAVMLPHTAKDKISMDFAASDNKSLVIKGEKGTDYIAGKTAQGVLVNDAIVSSVSLRDGKISGYSVTHGKDVRFKGQMLVKSSAPVQLINDGKQIVVKGPEMTKVECLGLGANAVKCNGAVSGIKVAKMVKFIIPRLSKNGNWNIKITDNGKKVIVTGKGKLPLRIKAPLATDCVVNGVSRYFTRDRSGNIYPQLESGTVLIQPNGYPNNIK